MGGDVTLHRLISHAVRLQPRALTVLNHINAQRPRRMLSPNVIFIWRFVKKKKNDDGRFVFRVVIVEMTGNIKGLDCH